MLYADSRFYNYYWIKRGDDIMTYSGFMRGMATGLVVGAAVTMITDPITDRQRHKIAKKTEGVFKSVGSVLDTAMDMVKQS